MIPNHKLKIGITGAGGFLGAAAVEFFSQLPEISEVRALYSKAPAIPSSPRVRSIVGELKNPLICDALVSGTDCILHFAHRGFPSDREKNAGKIIGENVSATSELLQSLHKNQIKRFIYASSGGAIYLDEDKKKPFRESSPTVFRTPYAASKLINEYVIREFAQSFFIEPTVLRISNPYGLGQLQRSQQGIIGVLLGKIFRNERLTLWSSPETVKDFIYIDDLLSALHQVVMSSKPLTGLYNIGSGQGLSLKNLFQLIEKITGKPLPIDHVPNPVPENSWTVLDCSKFSKATGWKCRQPIEQGINVLWKALISSEHQQAA